MKHLEQEVEVVKAPWRESPYYEHAEMWNHIFWDENTVFRRYFDRLDLNNVIELACGHGRHSERVAPNAGSLTLIDVFEANLDKCRNRLEEKFKNVKYLLGNGYDFGPVDDSSATAIFSYDAMVHFSMDIMLSYLEDTARVLKQGGMALYHHSNYPGPGAPHYGQNPHARNIMNFSVYCGKAQELGLDVVDSIVMDWGGVPNLDRLTLIRKKTGWQHD